MLRDKTLAGDDKAHIARGALIVDIRDHILVQQLLALVRPPQYRSSAVQKHEDPRPGLRDRRPCEYPLHRCLLNYWTACHLRVLKHGNALESVDNRDKKRDKKGNGA
jgi:hypothetical protein